MQLTMKNALQHATITCAPKRPPASHRVQLRFKRVHATPTPTVTEAHIRRGRAHSCCCCCQSTRLAEATPGTSNQDVSCHHKATCRCCGKHCSWRHTKRWRGPPVNRKQAANCPRHEPCHRVQCMVQTGTTLTTCRHKQHHHHWQRTLHHTQYGTSDVLQLSCNCRRWYRSHRFFPTTGSGICSNTRRALLQDIKLTV
jgi:hypothetical protein